MSATSNPRRGSVDPAVKRARLAVAILFVLNGLALANLIPWYPVIKGDLGMSNTVFGIAVAGFAFGALAFGTLSGPLIARFGSARTSTVGAVVMASILPLIAIAPNPWTLALAMVGMGSADAIMDAAMNAHGLRVQRRYGRSIINSFHALWSAGAVVGGLVGSLVIGAGVPRSVHLLVVAIVVAVVAVAASGWLLPGAENTERAAEATAGDGGGLIDAWRVAPLVLLGLGVIMMASTALEDTAGTWSGVYLKDVVGAPAATLGLGFVASQGLMFVGRIFGDRVVDRFGPSRVARTGLLLSAAGITLVVLSSSSLAGVIIGFGLSGLGASTIYPLGVTASAEIPGVRSGDGITIVTWLARVGFLAVPPAIGAVADAASLPIALTMVVAAAIGGSFLAGLLQPPDARGADPTTT